MRARLLKVFTVVGAITSGVLALMLVMWTVTCATADTVPDKTVLELRLDQAVTESGIGSPLTDLLAGGGYPVREVVAALERGGADERVAGAIVYIDDVHWGMARAQEVRDAIVAFRGKGKFAVAFSESFGELSAGNQGYYVATGCDEIWLQPTGGVGLNGLMTESYFLKDALAKAGVGVEGGHRKEYKNAFNVYTERRFTEAHREAAQTLIDDFFGQLVREVSAARGLSEPDVRALADAGPYLALEAETNGLVDGLAYRDEVIAKVKERAGEGASLLYAQHYLERAGGPWDEGERIAVITGVGAVTRGASSVDPLGGEENMGSDTITAAFRAAIADEEVKAIVFRIDTPGGSPIASDAIWREVARAREANKPVIVSMGNVAASGGYYVSAGATKIVAQPATITGSIGVLGGKPITTEAWNKLGVTWDYVKTSRNADVFSHLNGYDGEGELLLQSWLDRVYAQFTGKVAEGRGLSADQVETIAKGRVWSGERALQLGLVDALGGLTTAIALARSEAGIAEDASVELRAYPEPRGWVETLFGGGGHNSDADAAAAVVVSPELARWRAVAAHLRAVGLAADEPGLVMMPPLTVGR
ncbi:MAG: signal peptide peptidase SppA [Myxococcota bacterium]